MLATADREGVRGMGRRDWVLAGTAVAFLAAGLLTWQTATPGDVVTTAIGALPLAVGIRAVTEFARRACGE